MRAIKKGFVGLVIGMLISINSISITVAYAQETQITYESRADIIEWRYKTENKKVYKRQYNCSKQRWIGEWEFVANIV